MALYTNLYHVWLFIPTSSVLYLLSRTCDWYQFLNVFSFEICFAMFVWRCVVLWNYVSKSEIDNISLLIIPLGTAENADTLFMSTSEPPHDKTNKMTVRPAKTQISLGIRSVWSVFAVRSVGSWGPNVSSCGQQRLWSDWADAQAGLSLRWAHYHFVGFVMRQVVYNYNKQS